MPPSSAAIQKHILNQHFLEVLTIAVISKVQMLGL